MATLARDKPQAVQVSRALLEAQVYFPTGIDPRAVRRRLAFAGFSVVAVMLMGVFGYWLIGMGRWPLADCAYMVVITLTTVGYGEIIPVSEVEGGRLFTAVLLFSGLGVSAYFLSALTAFIVEGDLKKAIWRRRMRNDLDHLNGHYLVCGGGETGKHVVEELVAAGQRVVLIEQSPEALDALARTLGDRFLAVRGDATDDALLIACGIERAAGLVTSLHNDRDNLFITITARQLNAQLRIVSRAVQEQARAKLLRAGADAIVSPNSIGGRRMAHELLHPELVGFLDVLGGSSDAPLSAEQCVVHPDSLAAGLSLAQADLRQVADALVVTVEQDGVRRFNPPPETVLTPGTVVVLLGAREATHRLTRYLAR